MSDIFDWFRSEEGARSLTFRFSRSFSIQTASLDSRCRRTLLESSGLERRLMTSSRPSCTMNLLLSPLYSVPNQRTYLLPDFPSFLSSSRPLLQCCSYPSPLPSFLLVVPLPSHSTNPLPICSFLQTTTASRPDPSTPRRPDLLSPPSSPEPTSLDSCSLPTP